MPVFNTQIIRIAADTTSKENILDLNTAAAEPQAWWAHEDLTIQVGVFAGGALLDVSDIESVTINLKDPSNLDGAPLVTKTVTVFDNTTTLATWNAGTEQHYSVAFGADDLSFSLSNGARLVHLSMVAVTTGGQTGTLFVGTLNIIDDGGNSPESNPVNAITVAQAEAMLAGLSVPGADVTPNANGTLTVSPLTTFLQTIQRITAQAGAAAFTYNAVLAHANVNGSAPMPGAAAKLYLEFPASANPTIYVYDNSTAGALLKTVTNPNPAAAAYYYLEAAFLGGAWHIINSNWIN